MSETTQVLYHPIANVEVRERQREIDTNIVGQLVDSIRTKGLAHAPVIAQDAKGLFLVVGEHRKTAMMRLHEDNVPFFYNGVQVPKDMMPCVNVLDLSPADLLELELEENIIRAEIPWPKRCQALAAIHKLRLEANPGQTLTQTAQELRDKTGKGGVVTGKERTAVRNALLLAANLHKPNVAKARNATEALGILLKDESAAAEAILISRKRAAMTEAEKSQQLIHVYNADFRVKMQEMPDGEVDLIIADLPYGINADKGGFRQRTVEHHNYEDTPEYAAELLKALVADGFRVTKPRANLLVFGDVDLFTLFKQAASQMGWTPFRTPIIWRKSESEGLAPWGREGFRRTYEMLFFATKGKRGLHQSPVDILDENRVSRKLRRLGPEKPVGLMEQLVECASMPGDLVLDPCCGGGSTLIACRHLKRRAIGIELSKEHYNLAVVAAERDPEGVEEDDEDDQVGALA